VQWGNTRKEKIAKSDSGPYRPRGTTANRRDQIACRKRARKVSSQGKVIGRSGRYQYPHFFGANKRKGQILQSPDSRAADGEKQYPIEPRAESRNEKELWEEPPAPRRPQKSNRKKPNYSSRGKRQNELPGARKEKAAGRVTMERKRSKARSEMSV